MPDTRFLTRVVLHDYKSIRYCDLSLPQFAVVVGPNSAGKSNFLDALRFVAEALLESLDYALIKRGGAAQVVRRSVDPLSVMTCRDERAHCHAVRSLTGATSVESG